MSHEKMSNAFRHLRERITKEKDSRRLHELLTEIDALLVLVEEQIAKIEGQPRTD
jgi:hypothetical protein